MPPPPQSSAPDPLSSRKTMLGIGSDLKNSGVCAKAPINQYNRIHPQFPPLFRLERRFEAAQIVLRKVSKTIRRRLKTVRMWFETLPNQLQSRKTRVYWAWDFWDYDGTHIFPILRGKWTRGASVVRFLAPQLALSLLPVRALVRSALLSLPLVRKYHPERLDP